MQTIDEVLPYLEDLKISAFRKAELIKNEVHNVTIGPNSSPKKGSDSYNDTFDIQSALKKPSKNTTAQYTVNSHNILPFRQIFREIELERQQDVKEAVENHTRRFEVFEEQQNTNSKQQWFLQQQKFIQKMQDQEKKITLALKEYENNKSNYHKKLTLYYQDLEEQRKKSAELLEVKKKEKELLKDCLDFQSSFHSTYHEILMTIKNCQDEKLKAGFKNVLKQCKDLNDFMSSLILKCKSANVTIEERKNAEAIVRKANQLKIDVDEALLHIQQSMKQPKIHKESEKPMLSNDSCISQNISVTTQVSSNSSEKPTQSSNYPSLENYVSKCNFKWYSELIAFYGTYIDTFKDLSTDDRFKQFRFDCRKAINLSVNAISAVNSEHLRDKYVKLSNLLRGQNVVIGDFQINASCHPKGIPFSTDLLAKKFVLQGDLMISSNPDAAFCFATIIISLWNESLEFGKLLLTYFFKECPYLLPIYLPKNVDQTDKEFYESQGYRYIDGQIEKQDKFLKRMTGIMRLYFALLISHPKQGQNKNPHNIKIAWTWFVSVLKLEPRIDITATMLHTFLETVGYEMQNNYKIQFFKLLRFLVERYIPSLKKIDTGGPVTRLECLIQEFKENRNQFKAPSGTLSKAFW